MATILGAISAMETGHFENFARESRPITAEKERSIIIFQTGPFRALNNGIKIAEFRSYLYHGAPERTRSRVREIYELIFNAAA